jgi:phosphoesterase RecJ-like protein
MGPFKEYNNLPGEGSVDRRGGEPQTDLPPEFRASPLASLRVPETELQRAIFVINAARKIAVISHVNPDADAYASSVGLTVGLRGLGKDVTCFNTSGVVSALEYLPLIREVKSCRAVHDEYDLAIVSDCSAIAMLGRQGAKLLHGAQNILNLDHHHLVNTKFGDINVVAPNVSSSSELVAKLLKQLRAPLSSQVATLLLAGIYDDTLSLQKVPPGADTFKVVDELVKAGGELEHFTDQMFRSAPLNLLKLQAHLIQRFEPRLQGRYGMVVVHERDLSQFAVRDNDVATLRGFPLAIEGVLISSFIQKKGEFTKVSLRSKGPYAVHEIALELGGAGHRNAAGFITKIDTSILEGVLETKVGQLLDAHSDQPMG